MSVHHNHDGDLSSRSIQSWLLVIATMKNFALVAHSVPCSNVFQQLSRENILYKLALKSLAKGIYQCAH